MAKRVMRGYSVESLSETEVANEAKCLAEGAVWHELAELKRVLRERAGTPKKTKITILVEFE